MTQSRELSPYLVPDFTPVPRKNSVTHGWTVAKQRGFISALAATGSVRMATEAVGMSHCGVYKLRHAPGGKAFADAWDAAVAVGAKRVRDVLIDQAIHGIPERVLIGKDTVIERRRFNHRTMIWVLQHHMADMYPGGSTTQRREQEPPRQPASADELRAIIHAKLEEARLPRLRELGTDPVKRAAYELLNGPTDWPSDA